MLVQIARQPTDKFTNIPKGGDLTNNISVQQSVVISKINCFHPTQIQDLATSLILNNINTNFLHFCTSGQKKMSILLVIEETFSFYSSSILLSKIIKTIINKVNMRAYPKKNSIMDICKWRAYNTHVILRWSQFTVTAILQQIPHAQ